MVLSQPLLVKVDPSFLLCSLSSSFSKGFIFFPTSSPLASFGDGVSTTNSRPLSSSPIVTFLNKIADNSRLACHISVLINDVSLTLSPSPPIQPEREILLETPTDTLCKQIGSHTIEQ